MSKKKKTVTAPLSYDPGKGRPKEYLAYLNWQEMQALRQINGEGPYTGPKGIPSFVLGGFGSAGSGTYSSSGSQQRSSTTGARGPTGPGGEARSSPAGNAGGGAGSVSRTSGSQEGSRQGGGGSGTAGASTAGRGPVGGPVSSSSRMTGPSSSLNAPARTQASVDAKVRQSAATADASRALSSSAPLKGDLRSGGINQINVGPMGTPVKVGGQVKGAVRAVAEQAYRPAVSPSDRLARTGPIGAPAYSPTMPAQKFQDRAPVQRYDSPIGPQQPSMSQLESEIRGIYEGTFAPYEPRFSTEQTLRAYQAEMARKAATAAPAGPNRGLGASPAAPQDSIDYSIGANSPFADRAVGSYDPNTYNRVMGIPDSGVRKAGSPYVSAPTAPTPDQQRAAMNALKDRYSLYSAAATPKLNYNRDLASDGYSMSLSEREGAYLDAAGNYPAVSTSRYAVGNVGIPTMGNTTGLRGVDYDSVKFSRTEQLDQYSPWQKEGTPDVADEGDVDLRIGPNYVPGKGYVSDIGRMGPFNPAHDLGKERIISVENLPDNVPEADDGSYVGEYASEQFPKNVSPEVQREMERIDALNKAGVAIAKRAPVIGPILSAADALRGVFTGNRTTAADAALKRQYMQSSDQQKAEMERQYPNLTRFANDAGIGSQLPESNYTSWAARSGLTGSGARDGGGEADLGTGIGSLPVRRPPSTGTTPPSTGSSSGGRPYTHYQWDLGINIPSPGDPNYNDYQRYLELRETARSAFG